MARRKKDDLEALANDELPKDLREVRRYLMNAFRRKDDEGVERAGKVVATLFKISSTGENCVKM